MSYSGSSEDNDFRDDRTQKAEKIGVTQQNSAHKGHVEMQHFHILGGELRIYFKANQFYLNCV